MDEGEGSGGGTVRTPDGLATPMGGRDIADSTAILPLWRAGAGAWVGMALLWILAASLMADLVVVNFSVLWLALLLLGFVRYVLRSAGIFTWWVAATPEGLCVRGSGRWNVPGRVAVRVLPWGDLVGATARKGGSLEIVGSTPGKGVVIDYAGFRAPKRVAREIAAMVADPALRPTAG